MAIELHRANRLIFELNQIVGIEEVVLGEQGVANFFRVAIKGAGGAQGFNFFSDYVALGCECKVNYTAYLTDRLKDHK